MEIMLDEIPVICVISNQGPSGAQQAFHFLESKIGSLKGRRFYGTMHDNEYRACVALCSHDSPEDLALECWIIPGGKYIQSKLMNWPHRIRDIEKIFAELSKQNPVDTARPNIEYYKSNVELRLLLPIF